jgi:hypothetical protein
MSGTTEHQAEQSAAADVPDLGSNHLDADAPIVSEAGSDGETARDPRETLIMKNNLDWFCHRERLRPARSERRTAKSDSTWPTVPGFKE